MNTGVFRHTEGLSCTIQNYADTWVLHCNNIFEPVWSSAVNLNYDVIMEKQTTQFYLLVLNVFVVWYYMVWWLLTVFSQLWGLCTALLFIPTYHCVHGCSTSPPKWMYRAVRETAIKEWECEHGGESDTFTPCCQFACEPLLLHYPVLALLHRPPLSSRVWFSNCEI